MSVSEHDSLNQAERALVFTPDINDPTAGQVAISARWRPNRSA